MWTRVIEGMREELTSGSSCRLMQVIGKKFWPKSKCQHALLAVGHAQEVTLVLGTDTKTKSVQARLDEIFEKTKSKVEVFIVFHLFFQ